MQILDAIKSRRSTRKFLAKHVENEKLHMILEAGRYAPSGGNRQENHFIVIRNPELRNQLGDIIREEYTRMEESPDMYASLKTIIRLAKNGSLVFHYNAPVLILVANKKGHVNSLLDSACAMENMMLTANTLDLGSCWVNQIYLLGENARVQEFLRGLGMEEDNCICGALALGYADTEDGLPQRDPLKRTGNRITWID